MLWNVLVGEIPRTVLWLPGASHLLVKSLLAASQRGCGGITQLLPSFAPATCLALPIL